MPFVIRPYQPGDRPGLLRCIAAVQDHERGIDPRLRPGREIADAYADHLFAWGKTDHGVLFVADTSAGVVGYVSVLARVPFEGLDQPPGTHALVSDLGVLETHRRQGIGRALLKVAEDFATAQGASELRIGVLSRNTSARTLYLDIGFEPYTDMLAKRLM